MGGIRGIIEGKPVDEAGKQLAKKGDDIAEAAGDAAKNSNKVAKKGDNIVDAKPKGNPEVKAETKPNSPETGSAKPTGGKMDIPGKWKTHFTEAEGFSKGNGVKGAHTEEAFSKYFSDQGFKYKEVSSAKHPQIDGIKDITYQVQAKDYRGIPIEGQYNATLYKKTLIDTSKISVNTINRWANEAKINGTTAMRHGNNLYFKGTANNGLKFEGWINPLTGEFDSLYPVLDWIN